MPTLLLTFWRECLIALIALLLGLQTLRLQSATHELETIKLQTKNAKEQSNATVERLREAIPIMVKMARSNAVKNYQAKFGAGNAACGIRASGLLPTGSGEAGRTERTTDLPESKPMACDPATIEAAAVDAVMLEAWKDWAKSNGLKGK